MPADVDTMRRQRDAARAQVDYILECIKGDRFKDLIGQSAEDYVQYSLGTAACAYYIDAYVNDPALHTHSTTTHTHT